MTTTQYIPNFLRESFVLRFLYWQVWTGALLYVLISQFFIWVSSIELKITVIEHLVVSIFWSHVFYGISIAIQKILFPKLSFTKNNFLLQFGVILVAIISLVFFLQWLAIKSNFQRAVLTQLQSDAEKSLYRTIVPLSSGLTMALNFGLGSAQFFFNRLERTLAAEADAMNRILQSEARVRELELQGQIVSLEAEKARQLAVEAELTALKMQINPHFFFNTLSSIAALIRMNSPHAVAMVEKLAELFRYTLHASKHAETTLGEETRFLNLYLDIERARLNGRIDFFIDIPSSFFSVVSPNLLLQPLVENAVIHAFKRKRDDCKVWVSAKLFESTLEITVADNGIGFGEGDPFRFIGKGTALKNINDRLVKLFGESYALRLHAHLPHGAAITFKLPLQYIASETLKPDANA